MNLKSSKSRILFSFLRVPLSNKCSSVTAFFSELPFPRFAVPEKAFEWLIPDPPPGHFLLKPQSRLQVLMELRKPLFVVERGGTVRRKLWKPPVFQVVRPPNPNAVGLVCRLASFSVPSIDCCCSLRLGFGANVPVSVPILLLPMQ
ncbi:hypothetical protein KSP40_PGU016092 [Platanthera guangdongensis]|uniref:Uncharacterized protein n=1 Tax=Platanthera guangdongensis TaxID=2320717 RepID=A0ABR2LK48_9ASPA